MEVFIGKTKKHLSGQRQLWNMRWKVDYSYFQALEDNTIFICFLPLQSKWKAGWEVEQLILRPGEENLPIKKDNCVIYLRLVIASHRLR